MKHIPGYENLYAVDKAGNVWRIGAPRGRPLTPVLVNGYHRVRLSKGAVKKNFFVHQVVLLTYVGPKPDGHEPRHRNGVKTDNRLRNLRYGTHKENCADRNQHGTQPRGEQAYQAKLTEDAVREIRDMPASYAALLAKKYGVSEGAVSRARYRYSWKHVR